VTAAGGPAALIHGIHHVQLAAPPESEEAARIFYGGLLGLREIPKPEALRGSGGIWFAAGAQELHIGIEQPHRPARKAHPGLEVESGALDGLAARLDEAGYEVVWDDRIEGVARFHTQDPFGSRTVARCDRRLLRT
jgi:catechol 2,3-dioxygenase-like lactoylglutathione lyase family enzyme